VIDLMLKYLSFGM